MGVRGASDKNEIPWIRLQDFSLPSAWRLRGVLVDFPVRPSSLVESSVVGMALWALDVFVIKGVSRFGAIL